MTAFDVEPERTTLPMRIAANQQQRFAVRLPAREFGALYFRLDLSK